MPMFDAVHHKSLLIKELNSRSSQMIESWKQTQRSERAAVLGARARMLNQLSTTTPALTPCSPSDSNTTIESKYNECMKEIRANAKTEILESWKSSAVEQRRLIFATRHAMINEIQTSKPELVTIVESESEKRAAVMKEISSRGAEPLPAWKERVNAQKSEQLRLKNQINCDIREGKTALSNNDTIVDSHNKLMAEIRAPVEAWKQTIRTAIANPHKNMRLVLADVETRNFELETTQDAHVALMANINTQMVPEWKQKLATEHARVVRAKRAVICDISERKYSLKKVVNRVQLLQDIRAAYNIPESWTFCEGWKEQVRTAKSSQFLAHRNCMVSLEQGMFSLKPVKNLSRHEKFSAVMNEIRTASALEAWKAKVMAIRTNTFERKRELNFEIQAFDKKTGLRPVEKSVQQRKLDVLAELKNQFGSCQEAWKQAKSDIVAVQTGSKKLVMLDITGKKYNLKPTATIEETKTNLMAAIRARTAHSPVPAWQEVERVERATVQNARNLVMSELRSKSKKLSETKSQEQLRAAVLSEIRRHREPLEAWKEAERTSQAGLYANKRALMQVIASGVSSLENKRSQAELKKVCLAQIREMNKQVEVVPAWKEKRMQVRTEVLQNKVALNAAICALRK